MRGSGASCAGFKALQYRACQHSTLLSSARCSIHTPTPTLRSPPLCPAARLQHPGAGGHPALRRFVAQLRCQRRAQPDCHPLRQPRRRGARLALLRRFAAAPRGRAARAAVDGAAPPVFAALLEAACCRSPTAHSPPPTPHPPLACRGQRLRARTAVQRGQPAVCGRRQGAARQREHGGGGGRALPPRHGCALSAAGWGSERGAVASAWLAAGAVGVLHPASNPPINEAAPDYHPLPGQPLTQQPAHSSPSSNPSLFSQRSTTTTCCTATRARACAWWHQSQSPPRQRTGCAAAAGAAAAYGSAAGRSMYC